MTGKRFECLGSGEYWDNQEDYALEPKEVTALLNALNDENKQLKEELQQYKDKHKKWVKECEELHKDFEKDWKRWGRM